VNITGESGYASASRACMWYVASPENNHCLLPGMVSCTAMRKLHFEVTTIGLEQLATDWCGSLAWLITCISA